MIPIAITRAMPRSPVSFRSRRIVRGTCRSRSGAVPQDDVVLELVRLDCLRRLHVDGEVAVHLRQQPASGRGRGVVEVVWERQVVRVLRPYGAGLAGDAVETEARAAALRAPG